MQQVAQMFCCVLSRCLGSRAKDLGKDGARGCLTGDIVVHVADEQAAEVVAGFLLSEHDQAIDDVDALEEFESFHGSSEGADHGEIFARHCVEDADFSEDSCRVVASRGVRELVVENFDELKEKIVCAEELDAWLCLEQNLDRLTSDADVHFVFCIPWHFDECLARWAEKGQKTTEKLGLETGGKMLWVVERTADEFGDHGPFPLGVVLGGWDFAFLDEHLHMGCIERQIVFELEQVHEILATVARMNLLDGEIFLVLHQIVLRVAICTDVAGHALQVGEHGRSASALCWVCGGGCVFDEHGQRVQLCALLGGEVPVCAAEHFVEQICCGQGCLAVWSASNFDQCLDQIALEKRSE
eukprot:comp19990_c0_seq1/m.39044 comp19990_c0_seq1/g.39044  ORF comp19990_c0_seq1/g.39044 comp19990_c0_seq1/m.39044 type:complete len:356 (+) comp19990_c0_seq1:1420-2487(+)